jgi:hypothetical protein
MSELAIKLRLIGREILHERYIDVVVVPLTLAHAADRIEALEAEVERLRDVLRTIRFEIDSQCGPLQQDK